MLGELALKARMTTETLNQIEGIRCNEVMGAMYAFPRVFLPEKAIQEAKVSFLSRAHHYLLDEEYFACLFDTNSVNVL